MNRPISTSAMLLLLIAGRAMADLAIDVGNYQMLPNSQGQIIIAVSGGDAVAGLNFSVQVGDTGSQPAITSLDTVGPGTIFFGKNTGAQPGQVGNPRTWVDTTTVDELTGSLSASGVVAVVTVDTTGTTVGNSFPLRITGIGPINGITYTTEFPYESPPGSGNIVDRPLTVANGQISIVGSISTSTATRNSGATGNWRDPAWQGAPHVFPNYMADAVIDSSCTVTVDTPAEAHSLAIGNGGLAVVTASGTLAAPAGVTLNSGGTLSIGGSTDLSASTALSFRGGVLQVTGTSLTGLGSRSVNWSTFDGGFDISNSANVFAVTGDISGSGGLTKKGPGTLTLLGSNSYNGDTQAESGLLRALAITGTGSTTVGSDAVLEANFVRQHSLTLAPGSLVFLGALGGDGNGVADSGSGAVMADGNTYPLLRAGEEVIAATNDAAIPNATIIASEPSTLILLLACATALAVARLPAKFRSFIGNVRCRGSRLTCGVP